MNRLLYFIWLFIVWAVLVTVGCTKKEPVKPEQAAPDKQSASVQQHMTNKNEELNDTERLDQIVKKLNKVLGNEYTVVFGGTGFRGPLVTVDYGLFGRLSEEGLAVMITDAIFQEHMDETKPLSQAQKRLRIDAEIGKYVALAGYKADGFREWLEQIDLISYQPDEKNMPSIQRRMYAFSEGYQKGESERKSDQSAMK